MYKAKKLWLFAGMFLLTSTALGTQIAKADTQSVGANAKIEDDSGNSKAAESSTSSVVLKSSQAGMAKNGIASASSSSTNGAVSNDTASSNTSSSVVSDGIGTQKAVTNSDSNKQLSADSTKVSNAQSTGSGNKNSGSQSAVTTPKKTDAATTTSVTNASKANVNTSQKAGSVTGNVASATKNSTTSVQAPTVDNATEGVTVVQGTLSQFAAASQSTASKAGNAVTFKASVTDVNGAVTSPSVAKINVTNLLNPTDQQLNDAKAAAVSLYKKTGIAQTINVISDLPVGDPTNANYQAGYQAAAADLQGHKGYALLSNIGNAEGNVFINYQLLGDLYHLGMVYEAGRIANGADTSQDIHYVPKGIKQVQNQGALELGSDNGGNATNIDISKFTKTTNPYNIDISDPGSWWIDPSNDGKSGGILGFDQTNLQGDPNFQAGYQAFIKTWAAATDDFYSQLASGMSSAADSYANSIAYNYATDGTTIPLPIGTNDGKGGLLTGGDSTSKTLQKKYPAAYNLFTAAATKAEQDLTKPTSKSYTQDTNAIKAITTNLGDLVHVWNYYIPLFQPLIQSYLQRSILSNPVSLSGQNGIDSLFLNDGITFADITFSVMNGFSYGFTYAVIQVAVGEHLGSINFPQEIFSEYVSKVYTGIRGAIERVDYVAGVDGVNNFLSDYLSAPGTITKTGNNYTSGSNVSLDGKLDFTTYSTGTAAANNLKLSHDGTYRMADKYLGQIKNAALTDAMNGVAENPTPFLLNASKTGNDTIVNGWNQKPYLNYGSDADLAGTNALIKSLYDAEYKAVAQAKADYASDPTTMKSYAITQTVQADGSYTNNLKEVANGTAGTFTWDNPEKVDDGKNWYSDAYNAKNTIPDVGTVAPYTIDLADYASTFNYLKQNAATQKLYSTKVIYHDDVNKVDLPISSGNTLIGFDGTQTSFTVSVPNGYVLDDSNYTAGQKVNVTLSANTPTEYVINVKPIAYTVNNPGTIQGTQAKYLQGTVNEVISYSLANGKAGTRNVSSVGNSTNITTTTTQQDADGNVVTLPNDKIVSTATVKIYRTAYLGQNGTVIYTPWTTNEDGSVNNSAVVAPALSNSDYDSTLMQPMNNGNTYNAAYNNSTLETAVTPMVGIHGVTPQWTDALGTSGAVTVGELPTLATTNPTITNANANDPTATSFAQDTQENYNVVRHINLSVGAMVTNVAISIEPDNNYKITGTTAASTPVAVTDSHGNPIALVDANGNPITGNSVTSGADGSVEIHVPSSGSGAVNPGDVLTLTPQNGGSTTVTVPLFTTGALNIAPNTTGGYDVTGKSRPSTTVSVDGSNGQPLTNADGSPVTGTTDGNGNIQLSIPSGLVQPGDTLTIKPAGAESGKVTVPAAGTVATTSTVTVNPDGSYTITGTTAPGVSVTLTTSDG
ncbi:KxYKxGKxW signal peptide domain-containing protein, partial [Secundilactobacillus folii]